jgi:hypothetical protein
MPKGKQVDFENIGYFSEFWPHIRVYLRKSASQGFLTGILHAHLGFFCYDDWHIAAAPGSYGRGEGKHETGDLSSFRSRRLEVGREGFEL